MFLEYQFGLWALMQLISAALWIAIPLVLLSGLLCCIYKKCMRGACCPSRRGGYGFGPCGPHHGSFCPNEWQVLRQRYARGEIDTATFLQIQEHLQASCAAEKQRCAE